MKIETFNGLVRWDQVVSIVGQFSNCPVEEITSAGFDPAEVTSIYAAGDRRAFSGEAVGFVADPVFGGGWHLLDCSCTAVELVSLSSGSRISATRIAGGPWWALRLETPRGYRGRYFAAVAAAMYVVDDAAGAVEHDDIAAATRGVGRRAQLAA